MASLNAHLICRQTIKVRVALRCESHDVYNLWLTDSGHMNTLYNLRKYSYIVACTLFDSGAVVNHLLLFIT